MSDVQTAKDGHTEDLTLIQRDLAVALGAAVDIDKALHLCLETAIAIAGMDSGGIYLADGTSGSLDLICHKGLSPSFVKAVSRYEPDTPNARLVKAGKSIYISHKDLTVPLSEFEQSEGLRSIAIIPIHHQEKVIAWLNVASHSTDNISETVRYALEGIAAQIGSAIAHIRAEDALREQSRHNTLVLKTSMDGFFIVGNDGIIREANQAFSDILGYSQDELNGMPLKDIEARESAEEIARHMAEIIEKRHNRFETRHRRKDGRIVDVEISSHFAGDGDDKFFFTFVRDITEQKHAEKKISEAHDHIQNVIDSIADPFMVIDLNHRIVLANNAVEEATGGLDPVEAGLTCHGVSHHSDSPCDSAEHPCPLRQVVATGQPVTVTHTHYDAKGRTSFVEISASPVFDENGEVIQIIVACRDITKRKMTEEALRENEQKLASIIEHSNEMFYIHDTAHRLTYVSPQCEVIFGYTVDEMKINWTGLVTDNSINEEGLRITEKSIRTGEKQVPYTLEIRRKNGTTGFIEVDESPLKDENGTVVSIVGAARDITERKMAEESRAQLLHELSERVKEFRCLYSVTMILREPENTLDDIFQKTVDLMPQACQYPEITRARIIHEGKEFKTRNFKETKWEQSSNITVAGKTVGTVEVCYTEKRPDTGTGPFLEKKRQLIDTLALEMGEAIERRQGEKALRESEKRYRELVENMTSGVAVYKAVDNGKDFVFKEFNSGGEKMDRLDRKDVIGKRLTEAFPGVKKFGLFKVLQRVWKTGRAEYFPAALYKDEREPGGWRENWVYRLPTGEIVAVYNDITERVQAEEEKKRLATIIEQASEGIAWADLDGNLQYVNTAWAKMHGYESGDELVGKHLSILHTGEQMKNDVIPFNKKVKSNGHNTGYVGHVRKDGTTFPTEIMTTLMKDNEGKPTGIAAIMTDITERRQAEEQLLRAQKMQTLGTMAGGVAHDYNNLLVGVLGFASMIAGDPEVSDRVRSWAQNIEKAAKRMANLTRQLLAFGRGGKWAPSVLDMNKTVREALSLLKETVGKEITIETNLFRKKCNVEGDPGQMQQLVTNICVNAVEAMDAGGTLTVKTKSGVVKKPAGITLEKWQPGKYVHLTVSDTGCGMDKDTVARMFEPYFSTKSGGRGLGLATIFGIIKNHKGWVAVDTEPKRGTSIHIYLPLVEKATARRRKTNAITSAKRGSEKILVIDDEGVVTDLCRATLGKMGYRVLIANTGDKASKQLDRHPDCSLVVLDLVMPPPGGKAIFEAIRKNHPDLSVLIISGYDKPGRVEELLKAGAQGFLAKPFTPEDLSAKIREILDA